MAGGARNNAGLTKQMDRFAREVALGRTLEQASINAGYDGNPANASRRAAIQKVDLAIKAYREEYKETARMRQVAQVEAATNSFATDGVTLAWLIMETKQTLQDARAADKYKEAIEAIKLLAALSGFIRAGKGDPEPNKDTSNVHLDPQSPISIQVLNQFTGASHRLAGDVAEEREALIDVRDARTQRAVSYRGPGEPVEIPELVPRPNDEAVPLYVESESE